MGAIESVVDKLALTQIHIGFAAGSAILLSLINVKLFSIPLRPKRSNNAVGQEQGGPEIETLTHLRVGINLGGCILPLYFIFYLFHEREVDLWSALLLIMLVSLVVYPLTRVKKHKGLEVHLFGAIITASVGALLLGGEDYLAWAYMSGAVGTLIGGDLLHLTQLGRLESTSQEGVFIGGAGLMDAIFLSGLFAMLMAEALHSAALIPGI